MGISKNVFARLLCIVRHQFTPYQVLVLGFAALILVGTLLLLTPWASANGTSLGFIDALFTATSAVCVTGLVVVDTGTFFSLFGQLVIIGLIQAGGLGIMTMTTLFALLIGKRIRLRQRLVMQEALNQVTMAGVVRLTAYVLKVTLLIEFIGGTILALRWFGEYGWKGIYFGYWHAVSNFCNAGFDLIGEFRSLTPYVDDVVVNLVVTSLIILGGIGFTVIADVWTNRSFAKFALHTKVVLVTTVVLLVGGTLGILVLEIDNPATIADLSWSGKLLGSYFQSVSARTAGPNTLDIGKMESGTLFLIVILMFIGASPASTGGGVKTSTAGVLTASIWAMITGKEDAEVFQRRIPIQTIHKAFAVVFISAAIVVLVTLILSVTERFPFINLLFEATSAFGTVGLSTGITPSLTPMGKLLLSLTMFAGRVGPVTLALAIALRAQKAHIRYPEGKIIIG